LISNQRKFHLSFCRICKNRESNLENGIICGLTEKIADFEKNCSEYEYDQLELENLKNRFEKRIREEYPKSGLKGILAEIEFKRVSKVLIKKFSRPEKTYGFEIKKDNKYDKSMIGILWVVILLLVWGNFKNDFAWDLSSMNVVAMLVIFVGSFYFIYKGYFHKYPTLIKIHEKGIDNRGEFIFWRDILDYGIVNGKGDRSSEKYVVIGTISSGIVKIDVSSTNISQLQFVEILQHHKNVLQQHL
jgi:hypothetical protein